MCTKLPCPCSCEMFRVHSDEAVYKGPPGAWHIEVLANDLHPTIWLKMPFGHGGTVIGLNIYALGAVKQQQPSWQFNQNHQRPTLSPSILSWTSRRDKETGKSVRVEQWHGYIEDGVMMSLQQMEHIKQVRRGG